MTRRVLVLNHFAAPPGAPGGTRHVELFSRLEGWEAVVLAADRNLITGRVITGAKSDLWHPVRVLPPLRREATRVLSWCSYAVAATVSGLRLPRPDVVYASTPHLLAGLAGSVLATVRRVPMVLEVRDLWPQILVDTGTLDEQSWLYRLLAGVESHLYRQAKSIVVLTPGVAGYLIRRGKAPDSITCLPNGADPEDFVVSDGRPQLRARWGLEGFVVAYAGAHGVANGLELVLEAAAELKDELPQVRFLLVGDGPTKAGLVRRAGELGLTNVMFRDPVPKRDMPALLAAVDAGLHVLAEVPLFRYGVSPNKLFDYMAAGLPVVTNTEGEVAELVDRAGAGLAVDPHGIAEGVRRMVRAETSVRDAWGRSGRDYVGRHHSRSAASRDLGALLDWVARPERPPAKAYRGKRALDLVIVGLGALPAGVIVSAAAAAIKATSPGPVLFHQERVGVGGEPFTLLKLRTMTHGSDNPLFPDQARITSVGRWLRRLSIDELPQLVNVARGEMSIVGPRPTLAYQVARYDDHQRRRLEVRPGLTGLAQVQGRNRSGWASRIELDVDYVRRQSLGLDLRILARTLRAVAGGAGVEGHPQDDPIAVAPHPEIQDRFQLGRLGAAVWQDGRGVGG